MDPGVGIIGAGRVGTAIGILLQRAGFNIGGVVGRSPATAAAAAAAIGAGTPLTDPAAAAHGARLLFLTVPDQAVATVAARLVAAGALDGVAAIIHTSGVLPAAAMAGSGSVAPTLCLSLHPMQSIADPVQGATQLAGAYWGVEGEPTAVPLGENLVRAMGGIPLAIKPGQKGLYHAAACTVSNYLVSLMDMGLRLMAAAGIDGPTALPVLGTLMAGTLANIEQVGVPAALTGPIERGDVDTIANHLAALTGAVAGPDGDQLEGLYKTLGIYTAGVARAKAAGDADDPAVNEKLQRLARITHLLERGAVP